MKIEQLRQILEVYEAGSINRAAQKLYIAQSTLSSSIRAAEEELQQDIFIRKQKGIELTEFGHFLIEHTLDLLSSYDTILDKTKELRNNSPTTKFRVSAYYLLFANRIFYQLYNKYSDKNIEFVYKTQSRERTLLDVARGKSEIGLLAMPIFLKPQWLNLMHSLGLEYCLLAEEPPRILFNKTSSLNDIKKDTITIDELQNYTMISIKEQLELFIHMDAEIVNMFHPHKHIQINDRDLLMGMLLQATNSYYVATLNQNAYKIECYDPQIRTLLVEDATYFYEFGLVKRQNSNLSALVKEYIALIREAIGANENSPN